jgi:hypothetical protein
MLRLPIFVLDWGESDICMSATKECQYCHQNKKTYRVETFHSIYWGCESCLSVGVLNGEIDHDIKIKIKIFNDECVYSKADSDYDSDCDSDSQTDSDCESDLNN